MESGISIVSSKLRPPTIRQNVLVRPRLVHALDLIVSRRLTLVCAGPGYGKTTLIAGLAASRFPLVWYSLSPTDRDLAVFAAYLVQGIRRIRPQFSSQVLQLLSGEARPGASAIAIASRLVAGLSELGADDIIIVLDDFHLVDRSQEIRKAVDYIATYLPSNVHLVIATRRVPRLPSVPRLRVMGEVNDLTEHDLRFTTAEIQELFSGVYRSPLPGQALETLAEQTEGWVIGLQLAGQSLTAAAGDRSGDLLASLRASKGRLFEYLAEEVFKRQPANVRQFLAESSALSTLTAESCDAIFGRNDSSSILDHIERNNLFAVEVGEGSWRYHHLFRDFLRLQVRREPGKLEEIHRRAGQYFEVRGDDVQTIQHYLAGGDYPNAVKLIKKVGQALLGASRFDTLTFWITQIPGSYLREAPDLLFVQAQVFELQGHFDRSLAWLQRAGDAYGARHDGIGLSKVLRSKAFMIAWRFGRHAEAEVLYGEALAHLTRDDRIEMADVLACIAFSSIPAERPAAAHEAYERALGIYEEMGDKERTLTTLMNVGTWIHWLQGDFAEGLALIDRAQVLAQELRSKHRLAQCLGYKSLMLRHLDRYEEARRHAQEALVLSREVGAAELEAYVLTHLAAATLGPTVAELGAARHYLQEAARLAESEGMERIRIIALIREVLVLRRLGKVVESVNLGNRLLALAERSTDQWLIAAAQLEAGAALIDHDGARAEVLLLLARESFLRFEAKWYITVVNFWIAVLYSRTKSREALQHFQASLDVAKINGYDFWYAEEYRESVSLLVTAISQGIHIDYCARLLERIGPQAVDDLRIVSDHENADVRRVAKELFQALAKKWAKVAPAGGDAPQESTAPEFTIIDVAERPAPLRICCFGNFRVYVGDRMVQESEWQRKKAKSLLKYIVTTRDRSVMRDEVAEVFWGELSPDDARANLSRALYLLRRALEPHSVGGTSHYIASEYGLLTLRPELIVTVDVDEFQQHISAGEKAERAGDPDGALREYEAAEALYTGDLLADDPYEEWTMARRDRFKQIFLSLLQRIADLHVNSGEPQFAIPYLQRILVEDSTREDILASLMRCLARTGRRREALAQYATCSRVLRRELGLEPSSETQALQGRLLAGDTI